MPKRPMVASAEKTAEKTRPEDLTLAQLQEQADELRTRLNRFRTSLGRFFVRKQELIDLMVVASVGLVALLDGC